MTASGNAPAAMWLAWGSMKPSPLFLVVYQPAAFAAEVRFQPGMLGCEHGFDRTGSDDAAFGQHRDAVANRVQAVEIVGHHEDAQAQRALQGADQCVELGGADRIEARSRLVEENDIGIERQRACQRNALDHAAGQLGGIFAAHIGVKPDHFQFGERNLLDQARRQVEIFADRKLNVLQRRERREQRALLEQHAPAPLDRAQLFIVDGGEVGAEHFDAAVALGQQPDDGAHQHRLAGARAADEAEDLAFEHVERRAVEHGRVAEADGEIAHADHGGVAGHAHIPIAAKNMAKKPSSTMTRKIDLTTDEVVFRPSEAALPSTSKPSTQATSPITSAMNGALIMPTANVGSQIASRNRARKISGVMPP